MPEQQGRGFRERIQFDEPLWREIEAVSNHLKLRPADLVRMLTAMGIAQMKGLTMMNMAQMQQVIEPAITEQMDADFERMTGVPASSPVVGTAPRERNNGR